MKVFANQSRFIGGIERLPNKPTAKPSAEPQIRPIISPKTVPANIHAGSCGFSFSHEITHPPKAPIRPPQRPPMTSPSIARYKRILFVYTIKRPREQLTGLHRTFGATFKLRFTPAGLTIVKRAAEIVSRAGHLRTPSSTCLQCQQQLARPTSRDTHGSRFRSRSGASARTPLHPVSPLSGDARWSRNR